MSSSYQTFSITKNVSLERGSHNNLFSNGFLGWKVLQRLHRDAWLLILTKGIRLFAYGFLAVMLVIYLESLSFTADQVGILFTLTLLGDAALSILLTSHADRWGRKKTLIGGCMIAIITSFVFATQKNFYILLVSGILGVISPSGSEIGPFMAIEISSLSEVCSNQERTAIMAWYNLFGSFFSAFGALTCGGIIYLMNLPYEHAGSFCLIIYGLIQTTQLILFFQLSSEVEVKDTYRSSKIGYDNINEPDQRAACLGLHKSKWIVLQLSLLFMLDSFAGSFVLQSIISAWFYDTYHTSSRTLGSIVFCCNIIAGISALFAVQIANRIGLVLTMVVTHLPSNILLILVPIMPTEVTAILFLCARYSISQMDVPTRNAYVQGVVDPDERSAANGVTNVIRSIGASLGPLLSGYLLASPHSKNYPFYIAGGLKILYDLLLLYSFAQVQSTSDTHLSFKYDLNKSPEAAKLIEEKIEFLEKN